MINKRNGVISLLKFCFCIMVLCLHTNALAKHNEFILFKTGNIAVIFFFIISGYYLTRKALKEKYEKNNLGKDTVKFILNKIKVYVPYLLIAYLIELVIKIYYEKLSIYKIANSIWNLLLLQSAGFDKVIINIPIWYLSTMIISMMLLYPIIKKYKYNYIYLVSPFIVIIGFGYIFHYDQNIYEPFKWYGLISKGLLTGFLEMNIGAIIYVVNEWFKNIKFTKISQILLTIFEIGGYLFIFLVSFLVERAALYSYVLLLLLIPLILVSLSEHTLEQKYLNKSYIFYLERLSLPLYICHHMFVQIVFCVGFFQKFSYYVNSLIVLSSSILTSVVLLRVVTYVKKNNYLVKVKKIFINDMEVMNK